jgi:hypothetical protein
MDLGRAGPARPNSQHYPQQSDGAFALHGHVHSEAATLDVWISDFYFLFQKNTVKRYTLTSTCPRDLRAAVASNGSVGQVRPYGFD